MDSLPREWDALKFAVVLNIFRNFQLKNSRLLFIQK